MKSNFDFLNKDFPVLANFGKLAEQYCFSDANSCLIKLGMMGETIVNLMFTYDGVKLPCCSCNESNYRRASSACYRTEMPIRSTCEFLSVNL